jgi:hypothetical protein
VHRGAVQDVVESGGRVLVTRVVGMQLLDPSPRRVVQRGRRGAFNSHHLNSKTTARRVTNPMTVPERLERSWVSHGSKDR